MAFFIVTEFYLCKMLFLRCLIICFVILTCSENGLGQKTLHHKLDDLKKSIRQSTYYDSAAVFEKGGQAIQLARALNDLSEEATIYQYYGNFFFFSYNFNAAKKYYNKSIITAQKAGDKKLINLTKIRLAFLLSETDVLAAEKQFKVLLNESIRNRYTENSTEIYNGLGNIYDVRQIKDESLKFYLKGLKLAEETNQKYHQAMILNNIGLIKFNNRQIKDAEKDFVRALHIIKGMNENRLSLNLNNNLGLVNKEQKEYKESVKYFHQTLLNAKKIGFPQGIGVAYLNLADSYLNDKKTSLALIYADSSLSIFKSSQQWSFIGVAYGMKSMIYRQLGDLNHAEQNIEHIFELDKAHPYIENLAAGHLEMSLIAEEKGDFKTAYFHKQRYHTIQDSLSELANKDMLAQMQIIYGKEKVENELKDEKNKNNLLLKQSELDRTKIQSVIFISFLISLLTIGGIYFRQSITNRKQQKKFTQDLIVNIDDERSRISKDLHDDLGQSLSMIKSRMNLFNSGKTTNLDGLEDEIGSVIEHTRRISHFLHPSFITKLGLERSLSSLVENTQNSSGLVCSLEIEADLSSISVDNQTHIYRIMQECINNTMKHAHATALKISILDNGSNLDLIYQDNGKGIGKQETNTDGIGLLTIKERADKMQAKMSVQSTPKKGYKIIFQFPKITFV
jgi:signal transduction histidine kinase